MREYLFHGKRIDDGVWVEGDFRNTNGMSPYSAFIVTYSNEQYNTVFPESVGQYTGMNDIGDERIFEGDIMATAIGGITYHRGVVEFADGAFGLRCADGAAFFLCFVAGNYKKIGTVFEDADLLEG